ncbi:MAG: nuclear transport factor 2 family protein [Polaromonas sp.]|nr:nuclear transport factor 2 family protein [Polaromonas sp.]
MTASLEHILLAAEETRRQVMLAADVALLGTLLSDTLSYTHSTGVTDSKQSYLELLASGSLRYEALEFAAPHARLLGTAGLVSAVMRATVRKGDVRRDIASSYLAVWEHTTAGWVLQAVQATALPANAV